jgi:Trk K+ transport system NAD-binding subunit
LYYLDSFRGRYISFLQTAGRLLCRQTGRSAPQNTEPHGEALVEEGDGLVLVGKTINLNRFMEIRFRAGNFPAEFRQA